MNLFSGALNRPIHFQDLIFFKKQDLRGSRRRGAEFRLKPRSLKNCSRDQASARAPWSSRALGFRGKSDGSHWASVCVEQEPLVKIPSSFFQGMFGDIPGFPW